MPGADPLDGLRLLMEEIDAIERRRTYKQVPKEPAANGQATLTGLEIGTPARFPRPEKRSPI